MRLLLNSPRLGTLLASLVVLVSIALPVEVTVAAPPQPTVLAADPGAPAEIAPNDRLGIAHISYGSRGADERRYELARSAGTAWNRWVAYWTEIERAPGIFDYSKHDATITADLQHGLQLDVVLMGTPGFYATTSLAQIQAAGKATTPASSPPRNLELPVFADGSDELDIGKPINPENFWARYVGTTVARYRGQVRYWEIWNEPDFSTFWWTGDGQEMVRYLRLLKVAYLAAKAADPDAQIVLGGLMYWEWSNRAGLDHAWLRAFLRELATDQDAQRHGGYFDVLALHWYARSRDVYDKTLAVRQLLAEHGLSNKPIWINESDIGVCADPQTGGKPDCTPGVPKGRPEEQASFILQATANAFAAGADKLFIFQLQDDAVKPFDYYGLVRNDGTPRPAYFAYQVASRYIRELAHAVRLTMPPLELVRMERTDGAVVTVAWNSAAQPISVAIPAMARSALLVGQDGQTRTLLPAGGAYALTLPGATLNLTGNGEQADYPVGGYTYVLVERPDPATQTPTPSPSAIPAVVAPPTATATPAPPAEAMVTVPVGDGTVAATPAMTATRPEAREPSPTSATRHLAADLLAVPAELSTVRISDVGADRFTVSWVSSAPATGTVRCGQGPPFSDGYAERPGEAGASTTHLVVVTDRQPNTAYLCEVQAGVEVDNNGGAYFRVTTRPAAEDGARTPVTGSVVDEQGRPKGGVLVYGMFDGGCPDALPSAVTATRADGEGRFTLSVAAQGSVGRCSGVGDSDGQRRLRLTAVGAVVLAAERQIGVDERSDRSLRLGFTWSPYPVARLALPAGWSELSLPLRPLGPLTVDDFARELAAQGGRLAEVFWQEDRHWQGGPAAGSDAPLLYGRRYLVNVERPGTWVMRGLAP